MPVFAFGHRAQLKELPAATPERIGAFKGLCLDAALAVADGRRGYGILCDSRLRDALWRAAGTGLWIGRPVELSGSRPLRTEPEIGPDFGGLSEWPLEHVVKVLCFCHPDDPAELRADQEATVVRLFHAARRNRLEFLLEVIQSKSDLVENETTARAIQRVYDLGVYPDWWKLAPMRSEAARSAACAAIKRNDPHTRGIIVLGYGADEAALAAAAKHQLVKGFAVGRTIFLKAAKGYMTGHFDPELVVERMTATYRHLCGTWDRARAAAGRS